MGPVKEGAEEELAIHPKTIMAATTHRVTDVGSTSGSIYACCWSHSLLDYRQLPSVCWVPVLSRFWFLLWLVLTSALDPLPINPWLAILTTLLSASSPVPRIWYLWTVLTWMTLGLSSPSDPGLPYWRYLSELSTQWPYGLPQQLSVLSKCLVNHQKTPGKHWALLPPVSLPQGAFSQQSPSSLTPDSMMQPRCQRPMEVHSL